MEALTKAHVDWGVAALALAGRPPNGDLHVVRAFRGGMLLAAVDGLGHGSEAAAASRAAGEVLKGYAGEPVIALLRRCHAALRTTRGVAMSVASLDYARGLVTWLGVGSVQGALLRPTPAGEARPEESLMVHGGLVGAQLPPLRASVVPVAGGDTLVLATDGVASDFERGLALGRAPQAAANAILARHGKGTDDALVLVARLRGRP
ncbi:MAG TPA: SpoIIE family protein phosphatase [Anaeromyxobacteraceae bacterium]|jgi:serine phosphatase RsbU (regulator of sigma subunit)